MTIRFKRRIVRTVSVFLLVNMAFQLLAPFGAYALTSGPSTPEVQTFTPAGTTDMVDIFTGNFGYNLPVFELPGPNGGYPFNLSYTGGVSMDQEASWVGLGWNLNPGAINRDVRGLPDDFDGDIVKYRHDMKENSTIGVNVAFDVEFIGADAAKGLDVSIGLNLYYNSYRGFGLSLEPGVGYHGTNKSTTTAGVGLNLKLDSQEGAGVNPTLSLSSSSDATSKSHESISIGIGYNSKRGLTDLSYGIKADDKEGKGKGRAAAFDKPGSEKNILGGSISFAHTAYSPSIDMEMRGYNLAFTFKGGGEVEGVFLNGMMTGYYSTQYPKDANVDIPRNAYGYLAAEHIGNETDGKILDFNREKDGLVRKETPNLWIPSMTHDAYSMSGQGTGGSFRPYRPQVGIIFDPHSSSLVGGFSTGFDIGGGTAMKYGFDFTVNVSRTTSDESGKSDIVGNHFNKESFTQTSSYNNSDGNTQKINDYESYYFKATGEPTSEKKSRYDYMMGSNVTDLSNTPEGGPVGFGNAVTTSQKNRKPRNTSIQPYKNSDLKSSNYLPEFNRLQYYNGFGATTLSDYKDIRTSHPDHHIGGYTTVQPDGSRYIYGLPVYNMRQVDKQYSTFSTKPGGGAWREDVSGSESDVAQYMLPVAAADGIYHKLPPNSQNYLNRTELPQYTTSHLITAILGADYVDVDNNGPSDNDFGYWVKFNYVKVDNSYKWKVPYLGASYSKGSLYFGKDDKASYEYGEKEVYYLKSAETKTHIALFSISQRRDGAGIPGEFKDQDDPNASSNTASKSYKLDAVTLYSKMEYFSDQVTRSVNSSAQPISTAHFEYSYELCPGVPNFFSGSNVNDGPLATGIDLEDVTAIPNHYNAGAARPGNGKLTLKKVWFTYERSSRGELSPYQFHYSTKNPVYEHKNQDRWGVFKDTKSRGEYDYPYSVQDKNVANNDKATVDENAGAWNLTSITTPSASRIKVSYEADEYAYVQNKVAGQMFKIARTNIEGPGPGNGTMCKLYDMDDNIGDEKKIYFPLQNESFLPSLAEDDPANASGIAALKVANAKKLSKYIEDLKAPDGKYQLYYKVKIDMRSQSEGDKGLREYVSGYAGFDPSDIGFDTKCISGTAITMGYIKLGLPLLGRTQRDYHPFSAAAWNYLRTNMSEIASSPGKLGTPAGESMSVADKALEVVSAVTSIRDLFTSYYGRAARHRWASRIDVDHSFIRLSTPYKMKSGGGHRVSKIVIESDWDKDYEGQKDASNTPVPTQYGVTYDYTDYRNQVVGPNGDMVYGSSGVAQYEPSVGGDENSLRYAKTFTDNVPLKTANNLYFEYPGNESYYPSPTVGYSMVTVRSLATDNQIKNATLLAGMAGTGETVHEFFTAKDFPAITEETTISIDALNLYVPIPFIGEVKVDNLTAHQGYKIELNDMHGKPSRVSYYKQNADGTIDKEKNLVSYVEYTYKEGKSVYQNGNLARTISSDVNVMTGEGQKSQSSDGYEMGVEYDCFMDLRHGATRSGSGGLAFNTDVLLIGPITIPAFVPWPSISYSNTEVDMGVTNKIIRRTGILTETKAYDGNSLVVTDNLYYDAQTGRPVLTTVTNDFDAPIYKYSIPAYWVYDGMGAAYKNFGIVIPAAQVSYAGGTPQFTGDEAEVLVNVPDNSIFVEGDEFTLAFLKGTVLRKVGTTQLDCIMYDNTHSFLLRAGGISDLRIIRSGRKNLLMNDAGNITALQDPTLRHTSTSCSLASSLTNGYGPTSITSDATWLVNAVYHSDMNWASNGFDDSQWTQAYPTGFTFSGPIFNTGNCIWFNHSGIGGVSSENNMGNPVYFRKHFYIRDVSKILSASFDIAGDDYVRILINGQAVSINSSNNSNYQNFTYDPSGGHSLTTPPHYNSKMYLDANGAYTSKTDVYPFHAVLPSVDVKSFLHNGDNVIAISDIDDNFASYYIGFKMNLSYENPSNYFINNCSSSSAPQSVDTVLSSSVVKYRDAWIQDFSQYRGIADLTSLLNKYNSGEQGTWRPYESYTYVDDRGQALDMASAKLNNSYTKTNLKRDGSFNAMPVFDWFNPGFPDCFPKWRLTNTITGYNPYGYESENMDILQNYSAALYGYDGKLPTAVASNTANSEGAYEGFEEYKGNTNVTMTDRTTGNFTIVNSMGASSSPYTSTSYKKFKVSFGYGNTAAIDMDYNDFIAQYGSTISGNVQINAEAVADPSQSPAWPYENIVSTSANTTVGSGVLTTSPSSTNSNAVILQFAAPGNKPSMTGIPDFQNGGMTRCWTGYVYLPVTNSKQATYPGISFVTEKAHTGKVSMKATNEYPVAIPQFDLHLQAGKRYVIGGWMSVTGTSPTTEYLKYNTAANLQTYLNQYPSIKVGYGTASSAPTTWYPVNTIKSKVIDGWVRIEGDNFVVPGNITSSSVLYLSIQRQETGSNLTTLYLDDLRLHPYDGNMKSYVYDPQNYKLKAELDNNNYATFYSYDAQGNLFQIKRETEEGILTVQESRSHIKR